MTADICTVEYAESAPVHVREMDCNLLDKLPPWLTNEIWGERFPWTHSFWRAWEEVIISASEVLRE